MGGPSGTVDGVRRCLHSSAKSPAPSNGDRRLKPLATAEVVHTTKNISRMLTRCWPRRRAVGAVSSRTAIIRRILLYCMLFQMTRNKYTIKKSIAFELTR